MGISTSLSEISSYVISTVLTTSMQASFLDICGWLLKKTGENAVESTKYYIANPSEAPSDLWEWIKENKLTCTLIAGGILVIVVPLAIGFGPAGPVLGVPPPSHAKKF